MIVWTIGNHDLSWIISRAEYLRRGTGCLCPKVFLGNSIRRKTIDPHESIMTLSEQRFGSSLVWQSS
jgi:hypothetical protein